jgi:uncharacterized protein (DUF2062 family)
MIKEKILNFIVRYVYEESSVERFAFSVCTGIFIAFSPYHFFHTVLIFLLSWLWGLNVVITFAVTYTINNPWTMTFVYAADYLVGDYILKFLGFCPMLLNPSWMEVINVPLRAYTGVDGIAFWSFMLGGNLLGLVFGAMLYPIVKMMYFRARGMGSEFNQG